VRQTLNWIDIPPVWLLGFMCLAWLQVQYFPAGLTLESGLTDFLSAVLIGGGVILMLLAVSEMRKMRTTVIPHREADKLVTSGIFKRSRNPIYLGDVLVLAGVILRMDAVLTLPLVPILLWVLEKRFVLPEENRLRRKFRADFARYCEKTQRWI